jgi:hypothetical protein
MAKDEFTQYQKAVISGYYKNLDTIMLGKLSDMVSELYLAGAEADEAKQNRLWQRAHKAMLKLNVPPAIVQHIMEKRDVRILAKNLQDWLNGAGKG